MYFIAFVVGFAGFLIGLFSGATIVIWLITLVVVVALCSSAKTHKNQKEIIENLKKSTQNEDADKSVSEQ